MTMQEAILSNEYISARDMLKTILTERVEDIELSDNIPPLNDITDSNKVFKGKLSVLFVDMRKSTDLTDELKSKKMVKIYRSFIRMVVQAIRYCDGQSRQFAGDGVLGVFQDSSDVENPINSCEKAVRAARYILTLIDYCLNPQLKEHLDGISIGCGVGVCTGTVMVTKIGMRGKEADDTAENEMGIVWVGQTTNKASRLCSLTAPREIFIDEETYSGISDNTDLWKKETRIRGTKPYIGYISKAHYLPLADGLEIEPIISDETNEVNKSFVQSIFDETENRALQLVDEISKKSTELTSKIIALGEKEQALNNKEISLNKREQNIALLEQQRYFAIKIEFLEKIAGEFTKEQIKALGKGYLLTMINELKTLSKTIKYGEFSGGQSWRMSQVYEALELYEEFYHEVCNMAKCGFQIWESEVKTILDNTYLRTALKDYLTEYINSYKNNERSDEYKKLLKMIDGD